MKLRRVVEPLWTLLKSHDPGASWRPAAEANGLTNVQQHSILFFTTSVEGWKGKLHVRLESVLGDDRERHLQITVKGLAEGLSLRTEGMGARMQKRLGLVADIETGDDFFDADFIIGGAEPLARALLDADTRGALRRLFGAHEVVTLATGRLTIQFSRDHQARFLDDELERILHLAQRLQQPEDLGARVARNLHEDHSEGVRRRCLQELLARYGQHAGTREALRRTLSDESEAVRLEGALALGEEGREVLHALAASASEACAARAIKGLGSALEAGKMRWLLQRSLDRGQHAAAIACIEALGQPGYAGPAAEDLLTARGVVHDDEAVCRAAATALARVGTVAAVLPLQEAARAAGGGLRRALEEAARAIQSRLQGAERGQLTVSHAEGGTVSLAADGGEVSLPDPDGAGGE